MTMEDASNKWHIQCNARLNTSCTADDTGQASGPGWHTTIGNPQLEPLYPRVGTRIENYTLLVMNWNCNWKATVGTATGNYYIMCSALYNVQCTCLSWHSIQINIFQAIESTISWLMTVPICRSLTKAIVTKWSATKRWSEQIVPHSDVFFLFQFFWNRGIWWLCICFSLFIQDLLSMDLPSNVCSSWT